MNETNGKKSIFAGIASMLATMVAAPTDSVAQEQGFTGIEEVIVTAQRRAESMQDIPLAVTLLDSDILANNNATSLNDVINLVPNLSFSETGYGSDAIVASIRGQGVFGGRNPAVGMYLNEVPLPQVGPFAAGAYLGGKGLFFDMENIQVAKGPQGTLFGRNTTGGAFLLETRKPGDVFGGNLKLSYGNYDNVQVAGAVDVPLIEDKLLARVAVFHEKQDGFVDVAGGPTIGRYDAHDVDSTGLRATLTWRPTSSIQNDLIVSNYRSRTNGNHNIFSGILPDSVIPTYFPDAADRLAQQKELGLRDAIPQMMKTQYDVDLMSVINITSVDLTDTLTLRNIIGYSEQEIFAARNFDGSGLPLYQRYNVGDQPKREQTTEEIQLQGSSLDDRLNWTVGYFYLDLPRNGFETAKTVAYGVGRQTSVDYSEKGSGIYGQASYDLTEQLKLTLGYRHTKDKAKGIQLNLDGDGQCAAPDVAPFDGNCRLTLSDEWSANTWNVALDYRLTPDTLVYGAVRRGFRSGGFNFISVSANQSYGAEEITDYELGVKADWELAGMPVRTNAAIFYGELKDAQVTRDLHGATGDLVLAIDNAAEAEIKGMELEITAQPLDNLQVSLFASYLDFDFVDFVRGTSPENIQSIKDTKYYGRPEYTYGITADYTRYLDQIGELGLYANYSYTDEMWTDRSLDGTKFDRHGVLNLNLSWNGIMGRPYDLSFFITNALDEDYRTYTIAAPSLGFSAYGYGAPRMYGLRFNYRFGAEASY